LTCNRSLCSPPAATSSQEVLRDHCLANQGCCFSVATGYSQSDLNIRFGFEILNPLFHGFPPSNLRNFLTDLADTASSMCANSAISEYICHRFIVMSSTTCNHSTRTGVRGVLSGKLPSGIEPYLHPLPENRREGWYLRVIPPILAVASEGLGIASVAPGSGRCARQ
jgi:hypothetical protein